MTNTLITTMKTTNKLWAPADLEKLRSIYSRTPDRELATIFGRSVSAIEQMARRIGLPIRNSVGRGKGARKPWTQTEEDLLKSLVCEKMSTAEIAIALDRNESSVNARVSRMGIANRRGERAHMPIGSERLSKDGIPERKISCSGSKFKNWKRIDLIEWEAVNGPLPKDMVLLKIPGKPRTVENLYAVHKSDSPMHSTQYSMAPEILRLLYLKCSISRALHQIEVLNPDEPPERGVSRTQKREMRPEDEMAYLMKNYGSLSIKEMAKALCRRKANVVQQLHKLGLKRCSQQEWTP